jgi:hypothetical protein
MLDLPRALAARVDAPLPRPDNLPCESEDDECAGLVEGLAVAAFDAA